MSAWIGVSTAVTLWGGCVAVLLLVRCMIIW
jgi:hypothetical protein